MAKNMLTKEYGMNSVYDLSTGQQKIIRIYESVLLENVEDSFLVI